MYLFLIILSAIGILVTIIFSIHSMENVYDLLDLGSNILISALKIAIFCFIINFSYNMSIAEYTSYTTHHHIVSEQTNKNCNCSQSLLAKDNPENKHIQVNYETLICNQCKNEINHESNTTNHMPKEHTHKEELVSNEAPIAEK